MTFWFYIALAIGMFAGAMFLGGCSHLGVMLDDTCTVSSVRSSLSSSNARRIARDCRPIGVTYGGGF